MGNIALKENAELNLDMEAMTEETEGHCDEWNTRYKQLLENEKYFEEKRKEYDQELEKIKLLRASLEAYGMVKVTDSAAVTDSTGLALAATEKNALIPGTLGNKLAQLNTDYLNGWKTNPNTYVPVTYGDGLVSISEYDQVRCSKLNNGMRCINGALYATKEVTPSDGKPFLSVPNDFAVGGNDDSAFQRWLGLIEVSSGRVYNCRFSGNNIYGWGAYNIPANSTLSIYLLY